jgi:hypothetical protein
VLCTPTHVIISQSPGRCRSIPAIPKSRFAFKPVLLTRLEHGVNRDVYTHHVCPVPPRYVRTLALNNSPTQVRFITGVRAHPTHLCHHGVHARAAASREKESSSAKIRPETSRGSSRNPSNTPQCEGGAGGASCCVNLGRGGREVRIHLRHEFSPTLPRELTDGGGDVSTTVFFGEGQATLPLRGSPHISSSALISRGL